MRIKNIILNNFKIYKGETTVSFDPFSEKNIYIIAGKNGYGKTTFLTSLIWCFYGKLMSQVEDKFRNDISKYGGYRKYINSFLNKSLTENETKELSVQIELTDLLIPSIPCKSLIIKRSYNLKTEKEKLTIFIDGEESQLTKEIGYDVFIDDFVLPRDIAKFFFFDAEKIVSLAEANSKEDLRSLSKAYSEVLGIKKYEDLKNNLEVLSSRLRRKGVQGKDKLKIEELTEKQNEIDDLIKLNRSKQNFKKGEIERFEVRNNEVQEKLIREGNSITVEELNTLKQKKEGLQKQLEEIKSQTSKHFQLIPFAIAKNKMSQLKTQLEKERVNVTHKNEKIITEKVLSSVQTSLLGSLEKIQLVNEKKSELISLIKEATNRNKTKQVEKIKTIIGFDDLQYQKFKQLYSKIENSFFQEMKKLSEEEKGVRKLRSNVSKKIREAESKKNNKVANKYREEKILNDEKMVRLLDDLNKSILEEGGLLEKLRVVLKELSEKEKNYKLDLEDQEKYTVSQNLLSKVTLLITKIKEEKKFTLKKSLNLGFQKLSHKKNFIANIDIEIHKDIMEVNLIDAKGEVINKGDLSKGEQQLYASVLLKSLMDESGIEFPVFVDSPLQKLDKEHAKNMIEKFYPNLSSQIVLFPLLGKELSQKEFKFLQPNLNKLFVMQNDGINSKIIERDIKEVFEKELANV